MDLSEKQYYDYYQEQLEYLSVESGISYISNCLEETSNAKKVRALMRHLKKLMKEKGVFQ